MRIGMVVAPWLTVPPRAYGGVEAVVDCLARGLDAAGHHVLLCATGDSECPVPQAPGLAEATGLPGYGPRHEIAQALAAYRSLAEWEPDVIHDHTMVGPLVAADLATAPVVATNHTTFDASTDGLYRWCADHRMGVVAISRHQASTAPPGTVTTVIHHGIDVERCPLGDGDGGYAVFVGRFDAAKGVHVAIRVARRAGVPLRIAAKEPRATTERDYFESCVRPELYGDVEYVGEVDATGRSELLAHATCLLNPIQWAEPFGMVVIEALAHGTPVVATPLGSMPELIDDGETGFVTVPDAALADAVVESTTLDRELCRRVALARFSTPVMTAAHVDLYQRFAPRPWRFARHGGTITAVNETAAP